MIPVMSAIHMASRVGDQRKELPADSAQGRQGSTTEDLPLKWRLEGWMELCQGEGAACDSYSSSKVWPNEEKGYFWMSEAENPRGVWARGVEANRCVEGPARHAKDVLGMPARVGDRGILSQGCRAHSRHMLCGEQTDNIYQKYKCIAPPTQQWHIQ